MNRWGLGAAAFSTVAAMILPLWATSPEQSPVHADGTYSSNTKAEAKRAATDFIPDGGFSDRWSLEDDKLGRLRPRSGG